MLITFESRTSLQFSLQNTADLIKFVELSFSTQRNGLTTISQICAHNDILEALPIQMDGLIVFPQCAFRSHHLFCIR